MSDFKTASIEYQHAIAWLHNRQRELNRLMELSHNNLGEVVNHIQDASKDVDQWLAEYKRLVPIPPHTVNGAEPGDWRMSVLCDADEAARLSTKRHVTPTDSAKIIELIGIIARRCIEVENFTWASTQSNPASKGNRKVKSRVRRSDNDYIVLATPHKNRNPSMSLSELAREIGVQPSTITRTYNKDGEFKAWWDAFEDTVSGPGTHGCAQHPHRKSERIASARYHEHNDEE